MAIDLGAMTSHPSIKLRNTGDHIIAHVCHRKEVPWLEYGTNQPKLGKDGKPRTQERVTLLVKSGTAVVKGDDEQDRAVTAGETVTVYFSGHRRWEWIQAQKGVGRLQVGQVLKITYERDEASSSGNAKKIWQVQLRQPNANEAPGVTEAESIFHQAELADATFAPPKDSGFVAGDTIPF